MTVASIVGIVVAVLFVPMQSLGQDNWKIAAALMGSYIGGCKLCWEKLYTTMNKFYQAQRKYNHTKTQTFT